MLCQENNLYFFDFWEYLYILFYVLEKKNTISREVRENGLVCITSATSYTYSLGANSYLITMRKDVIQNL